MSSQTTVLTDVPAKEREHVIAKFKQMGASIESAEQSNGLYTLRVTINEDVEPEDSPGHIDRSSRSW